MSQATRRMMAGGIYQPRSRGAAMADALADARRSLARLSQLVLMRGVAVVLLVCTTAALLALISYDSHDASLNNATGMEPSNLLGGLGATAADLLLQAFGLAAILFLAPLLTWGFVAMRGRTLRRVFWRGFAWPMGTVLVAAGFGVLPAPMTLPAGTGGLLGIAAAALSRRVGEAYGQPWLGIAMPLVLLAVGLPLAFIATGLRAKPVLRGLGNIPALMVWAGSLVKVPSLARDYDDEELEPDFEEDSDADGYALDVRPEPIAAARLAERRESRIKRDEARRALAPTRRSKQPALDLVSSEYQLPALGLLNEPVQIHDTAALSDDALEENARMLEAVLADFGVKGRIMAVRPGPVVTLYEFEPAAGVKSSRVISLSDDVARSMSAVAARIAVIPGRNVIGIELPNQTRETVYLREMLSSAEYDKARAPLTLALGKTIGGEPVMADLAKMPHLLIAGTTGSGKSVGVNSLIVSILYRARPDEVKFILIDPKRLELGLYEDIPHLAAPIIVDPKLASRSLKWAVGEMERRYRDLAGWGVRNIDGYNTEIMRRNLVKEYDDKGEPWKPLPYIVIIIDELADLMMTSGREVEESITRLAQMARAVGIHLVLATQRPSVDVITGLIKANFPSRISFRVSSKIDSRTIIDTNGAEQLLGRGDMLFLPPGTSRLIRVHGAYIDETEISRIVTHIKAQGPPAYDETITQSDEEALGLETTEGEHDELFEEALRICVEMKRASTSVLQRRLRIGYGRAAAILDIMEREGLIGAADGSRPRSVLGRAYEMVSDWDEMGITEDQ